MIALYALVETPVSRAADVPDGSVEAQHRAARAADAREDWSAAHAAWSALLAQDPVGARSEAARTRLAWLAFRRGADGGFAAADALSRARAARDVGAMRPLVSDSAAPAAVRAEAALWLAVERPAEALTYTAPAWTLRDALPSDVRGRLGRAHARALAEAGRPEDASEVEQAVRAAVLGVAASAATDEGEVVRVERERARVRLRWASLAVIGAFGVAGGRVAWTERARIAQLRPYGLIPMWLLVAGGLAVAGAWDPSVLRLAPGLLAGWTVVQVVASASASAPARLRVLVGALAALASLGVAFLVLQSHEALLWVGL